MRKAGGLGIGAAVGVAGLLALGAPLVAQPEHDGTGDATARPAAAAQRQQAKAERQARRQERREARAAALAARTTFFAALRGRNEVSPETGRRGAGDMNGTGGATLVMKGHRLCFAVAVKGIGTPNGMHVHQARRGKNGEVVVPLTAPAAGDPGASSGCVPVAPDLAAKIQRRPQGFYVNVHTGEFPAGALRGQLHRMPRAA